MIVFKIIVVVAINFNVVLTFIKWYCFDVETQTYFNVNIKNTIS